ncbi:hypothetical protein SORBI_3001G522800 [Sorghum bicolor]|uniref:Uncharacterized protein n=1 Tax=Sorghum bicolor TaxID=4558 RepID=A0A1B6QQV7_SORBI|nr:hypothetical protein SORBI_3001G522800 [Sorghum bicolor]
MPVVPYDYTYRAPVVTRELIVGTSSAKAATAGLGGWGRRPHARPAAPRAGIALPLHEPQATDPATAINSEIREVARGREMQFDGGARVGM